jgi:[acyl-carrier-protein] S-malonyltransferase
MWPADQEGPKEALALTTNTQPVMLVAGVAAYRVWMAKAGDLPSGRGRPFAG